MKLKNCAVLVLLCVLAWPLATLSAPTPPAFQLSDLQKIVSLSSPQISPDGKEIAVVVSTPDWKTDKAKQEIDLVNVMTGTRRAQSPITYVRNVKAPTLLMGDVMDSNVPLVNAEEWYHGLRDNSVHVEFYAYPETTHFPHDVVQTTDVYRRWVGWMQKYLQ